MAATITSSGTWSTIATAERPTVSRDTVDQRFDYDTLIAEDDLGGNAGGFPELTQFLALMGQAYGISGLGALVRLKLMCDILANRTHRGPDERTYTP